MSERKYVIARDKADGTGRQYASKEDDGTSADEFTDKLADAFKYTWQNVITFEENDLKPGEYLVPLRLPGQARRPTRAELEAKVAALTRLSRRKGGRLLASDKRFVETCAERNEARKQRDAAHARAEQLESELEGARKSIGVSNVELRAELAKVSKLAEYWQERHRLADKAYVDLLPVHNGTIATLRRELEEARRERDEARMARYESDLKEDFRAIDHAVAEGRATALEEAEKVCEARAADWSRRMKPDDPLAWEARNCAAAIRALVSSPAPKRGKDHYADGYNDGYEDAAQAAVNASEDEAST